MGREVKYDDRKRSQKFVIFSADLAYLFSVKYYIYIYIYIYAKMTHNIYMFIYLSLINHYFIL